jgi:hypothetical protein
MIQLLQDATTMVSAILLSAAALYSLWAMSCIKRPMHISIRSGPAVKNGARMREDTH